MRFASSRLLTAALLTAAFALHGACGGSVDINFVGADAQGSGGQGSGGKATGGKSGGGSGNSTSSGGDGNSTSGGTTSGGGTDPGAGGEAGATGCAANPEICDDGIDNDCNGEIDCPILQDAFPEHGKAAAGADVLLSFAEPAEDAEFHCRIASPSEISNTPWENCGGPTLTPISEANSTDPAHDGLKEIQVRLAFPDNQFSDVFRWRVYLHHSLHGALRCEPAASDAQYFAAAADYISPEGTFGSAASLHNPFIRVTFEPPVDATVSVNDGDGLVTPLSLRKRFVTDETDQFLLMTRVYESRAYAASDYCQAAAIFVHDRGTNTGLANMRFKPRCSALVWNKKGAGVCLQASNGNVTLGYANNTSYFIEPTYDGDADNLLWRELARTNQEGWLRYFSKKCGGDPTCNSDDPTRILYLPDVELFD